MDSPVDRSRRREFPLWLLALALLGTLACWHFVTDETYVGILAVVARGIGATLFVTAIAFVAATLLGLLVAVCRLSRWRILRELAQFYIELVRGIPVLVLLFYIAFVGAPWIVAGLNGLLSPLIGAGLMPEISVRGFDFAWRAIFALTICYSAFIAEVFRAGIQSVDAGQIEAAKALGLTGWQRFRLVVLPQALRTILPPLGNDFIALIKDSALVSVLGVADITQLGKVYAAGLDVVSTEPIRPDNPLLKANNCFITPHSAGATRSARARLMKTVVENVAAFLGGSPQNVVN